LESHTVKSIMRPYVQGISLKITVAPDDKLTHAVKRMLLHNASQIAVVQKDLPVGILRLEDALKQLGL
jgi:predicted transcriptional regulator